MINNISASSGGDSPYSHKAQAFLSALYAKKKVVTNEQKIFVLKEALEVNPHGQDPISTEGNNPEQLFTEVQKVQFYERLLLLDKGLLEI